MIKGSQPYGTLSLILVVEVGNGNGRFTVHEMHVEGWLDSQVQQQLPRVGSSIDDCATREWGTWILEVDSGRRCGCLNSQGKQTRTRQNKDINKPQRWARSVSIAARASKVHLYYTHHGIRAKCSNPATSVLLHSPDPFIAT